MVWTRPLRGQVGHPQRGDHLQREDDCVPVNPLAIARGRPTALTGPLPQQAGKAAGVLGAWRLLCAPAVLTSIGAASGLSTLVGQRPSEQRPEMPFPAAAQAAPHMADLIELKNRPR